jgi:two-component system, LytTR family, sensor kinase
MDTIFTEVCALVTAAFVLTLVPGFRRSERSLLSMRDRGTALLVFLILGLVEEVTSSQVGWLNERIVAVCAAGLVAGPFVGVAVSIFVTWLAVRYDGLPFQWIGISMLCGGLVGGLLFRWRPQLAQRPLTGFSLTLAVSFLRNGLVFVHIPNPRGMSPTFEQVWIAPVLQGLGAALILAIVEQVRDHDEQTRVAAAAEVRALQARMNPHFLGNALNAIAALAVVAPGEVPSATGRLRQFLRASFDQHERVLVPLEEELALVSAYLHIESLRMGSRLKVKWMTDPHLSKALVPPFGLQPLVENAVLHGLHSCARAGRLDLRVHSAGSWLEMSVSDDGQGVPPEDIEQVFFTEGPEVHALALLRRRLQGLYGRSYQLVVCSKVGQGTAVTLRVPLRKRFGGLSASPGAIPPGFRGLALQ